MKTKKTVTIPRLVFACLIMLPVIRADEFGHATKFTFNRQLKSRGKFYPQVPTGSQ
jgi:hypothetical protein